jgi:hypothetical protein
MKPGISVQHTALPTRRFGMVRCDVAGVIGFVPKGRWPRDASTGDVIELNLRRNVELIDHPLRSLFDPASRRAVQAFFDNGGDQAWLFGVCIEDERDLHAPASALSVLGRLFETLRGNEDIALLACPAAAYMRFDISSTGRVSGHADALYRGLLEHCREMTNRFLLIDAPKDLHGAGLVSWSQDFRKEGLDPYGFGAVYYPWLRQRDELMPPSGAMMGLYARTEREHDPFGVVWPPANIPLRGVTHPEIDLEWSEASELAALSINPIVSQPTRGVVVLGARTLSKDKRWEFINARRIVSLIAEQLRRDNEWVVFERNDPNIWKILERDVGARLDEFWERGMLTGAAAGRDYEVRCDTETNSKEDREAGRLNVLVRVRPITTTEHITIDLRLSAADGV